MRNVGKSVLYIFSAMSWIAACGTGDSSTGSSEQSGSDGGGGPNHGGPPPGAIQGDASACNSPAEGCLCTQPGQSISCWTGPPSQRGVGACHDGTEQCVQNGEFAKWGPCQGEQLQCAVDAGGDGQGSHGGEDSGGDGQGSHGGEDSAAPQESGTVQMQGCPCVPGAIIFCDADCNANIICNFSAQKTCQPDGTWGPCHETGAPGGGIMDNPDGGGPCKHIGVGCAGCNNGIGYYTGDCSQALNCGGLDAPYCSNLSYGDSSSTSADGGIISSGNCTCN